MYSLSLFLVKRTGNTFPIFAREVPKCHIVTIAYLSEGAS